MSVDPIGFEGGDSNLYGYGWNSPVNVSDSLGQRVNPLNWVSWERRKYLEDIPEIMRAKGWFEAADLLDRWFDYPAGGKDKTLPDFETIKMEWVKKYAPVEEVYNEIFTKKIYINEAAIRKNLFRMLAKYPGSRRVEFGGNFSLPTLNFHDPYQEDKQEYLNVRYVGGQYDGFNGYTAALGRFPLYIGIRGTANFDPSNTSVCLEIRDVVVYVLDRFDFDDDPYSIYSQPLGVWWPDFHNLAESYTGINPLKGIWVNNKAFREYRQLYNIGGDFWILSDADIIPLSSTEYVTIN